MSQDFAKDWDKDYQGQDLQAKIDDNKNWPLTPTVYRFFEQYVKPQNGQCFLEAGCGFGKWNILLADKYPEWEINVGLDYSEAVSTGHQYNLQHKKHNISFVQGSVTELPLASNSFDALLNLGVIGHIENPLPAIEEMYRVLKPGGWLFADVVNDTVLTWRRKFEPLSIYEKFYSSNEFSKLFSDQGFEVKECFSQDFMFLATQMMSLPRVMTSGGRLGVLNRCWSKGLRLMRRVMMPLNKEYREKLSTVLK